MNRPHGQAMVEAVLGVLLFVTVIVFGIHFAEVGWLSLKAQEAAANAVLDSTARRIQNMQGQVHMAQLTGGGNSAANVAERRYRDFDGTSAVTGGATLTQVFTRAQALQVACEGGGLSFAPTPTAAGGPYRDAGALRCSARSTLTAFRMPARFLDEGGETALFAERHHQGTPIDVCAVGRAQGGECRGQLAVLLNDWGMSSTEGGENLDCLLGNCPNTAYRNAVQSMYAPLGAAGVALATLAAGGAPTDPMAFYMSFSGIEHGYRDGLGGHTAELHPYVTGGPGVGLLESHTNTGHSCFLGMPGPGCN